VPSAKAKLEWCETTLGRAHLMEDDPATVGELLATFFAGLD